MKAPGTYFFILAGTQRSVVSATKIQAFRARSMIVNSFGQIAPQTVQDHETARARVPPKFLALVRADLESGEAAAQSLEAARPDPLR